VPKNDSIASDPSSRLRSIEGRSNRLVKELRKAFATSQPTPEGWIAIEGPRVVEEAIRSGLKFRAVFFSASSQPRAGRLLPQIEAHAETIVLPDKLFSSAVPTETPQGVAALVRVRNFSFDDVLARASIGPIMVIAGLQDPGNLGTIVRSAEAFGAAGVVLGEGTVSAFNSKTVRASAGSLFRLPVAKAGLEQLLDQLRKQEVRLLATSSHRGTPLPEASMTIPLAVFIGAEGAGLRHDLLSKMDEVIAIPHSERVESLNAGIAASIVLYEIWRQKKS
jgi:RNA methyltransferase, TrmH family